ncbi:MAG: type II toxin-antitoxin system HicB family antitoxin [Dehalococcoidia bacterium]|nr:type II toxin-antitoxin system HicB family antitoxin [Dehalococcoidia bacterium]
MFAEYLKAAMRHAKYELLEDGSEFWGEIPGFQGVWATGDTLEACRDELEEVLEEWVLFRIAHHVDLPEVDGLSLPTFATV